MPAATVPAICDSRLGGGVVVDVLVCGEYEPLSSFD